MDARPLMKDQTVLSALCHAGLALRLTGRLGVGWREVDNGIAELARWIRAAAFHWSAIDAAALQQRWQDAPASLASTGAGRFYDRPGPQAVRMALDVDPWGGPAEHALSVLTEYAVDVASSGSLAGAGLATLTDGFPPAS
ncbi:MAG: hypothetical protein R2749_01425 [Acidimicrobiales bacterium]